MAEGGRTRAWEKTRRERERAAKQKKHLESLVEKADGLWAEVDQLIAARGVRLQPAKFGGFNLM